MWSWQGDDGQVQLPRSTLAQASWLRNGEQQRKMTFETFWTKKIQEKIIQYTDDVAPDQVNTRRATVTARRGSSKVIVAARVIVIFVVAFGVHTHNARHVPPPLIS